ncbi:MAG: type I glyceraldehyde-3-phosphate dehydrogenase [Holosporales bacterium]|jgi:glyceraldehyde 3-phosphate dehydrogenase|nr:type I glyceraldehyde-3-phosphate dehydrogenase [Holosporales bacterium]
MKIGINGFGRIGRMIMRAYVESQKHNNLEIACINDLMDKKTNCHLLKYDSVHGQFNSAIHETDTGISVSGKEIVMVSEREPEKINWSKYGVDLVLECSGVFTKKVDAYRHITAGANRVIVSAPSEGADMTVVYGINHSGIEEKHQVISNGSCTTNCLALIAHIISRAFGIRSGFMTTIHAYTGDQRLIDTAHKDLRRARAAGLSMIPSTTGAARAIGLVLPHLDGKLDGASIRVPTSNVSLVDLKCTLGRLASVEEINDTMRAASIDEQKGILGYSDAPLVSCDFNHSSFSAIFDATGTTIVDGTFCRVTAWYDNEYGFANRMLDLASFLAEKQ